MSHAIGRAAAALVLALASGALADDKSEPLPKGPDWSGYTFVTSAVGEVVRADDKKVILRITWYEPHVQKVGNNNKNNNNRNNNKNNKNNRNRPNLNGNNRNFRNPYAPNMNRPQTKVKWEEEHHDYELEYAPEALVRTTKLPPKFDDNGKKAVYTQKELNEVRWPSGAPGYGTSKAEVTPGTYLEVHLVRERSIPAAKATEDDLRIKYAIVLGKDPNPPKDIASPPKKKN